MLGKYILHHSLRRWFPSFCGRRLEGINATGMNANLEGLSSVSLRLTAPSAEGAIWGKRLRTRDFASAEARRWLSDRPRHPFGPRL